MRRTNLTWYPWEPRSTLDSLRGRVRTYLSRSCIPISEIGARAHLGSTARRHLTIPRTYVGRVASGQEASVSPDRSCELSA